MTENKKTKQTPREKEATNPSDIKGKIHVSDTRKRRDGPGGN